MHSIQCKSHICQIFNGICNTAAVTELHDATFTLFYSNMWNLLLKIFYTISREKTLKISNNNNFKSTKNHSHNIHSMNLMFNYQWKKKSFSASESVWCEPEYMCMNRTPMWLLTRHMHPLQESAQESNLRRILLDYHFGMPFWLRDETFDVCIAILALLVGFCSQHRATKWKNQILHTLMWMG